MVYLDRNVLIYASIEQDVQKQKKSIEIIEKLVKSSALILSPLVMQEYIFTLSKLKVDKVKVNILLSLLKRFLC